MYNYYLIIVLAPLIAAIIAGLAGKQIGRAGAHSITIGAVGLAPECDLEAAAGLAQGAGLDVGAVGGHGGLLGRG